MRWLATGSPNAPPKPNSPGVSDIRVKRISYVRRGPEKEPKDYGNFFAREADFPILKAANGLAEGLEFWCKIELKSGAKKGDP
jgi:hypothetical protein